ncbi:hypothetical protein KZ813_16800 [Sphingomonas sp. RHCKR7]|uniref:hypothetical protein n=1 Tax=Sphingomonas folli TaxID=2862497 RepID=UPI001CA512B5|nr:hypothetical protein [Sphingomonas folli]MBW6528504.1 hypothetical protein [Sphingomonas folli]
MSDPNPPTPEELAFLTDQELLTEWMKTRWDEGDARMEVLATEIERRGLDF